MTLLVFNFDRNFDGEPTTQNFVNTLDVPDHLRRTRWRLEAINLVKMDGGLIPMAYVDVRLPELVQNEDTIFSNGGDDLDRDSDVFRFYVDHHQVSLNQIGENRPSVFENVSLYPKWDLGEHTLDNLSVSCVVKAYDAKHNLITFQNYCVILSAE